MLRRLLLATLSLLWVHLSVAQLPDIDTFTRDMVRRDGLIPVYLDTLKGKLYLEVIPSGADLLLVPALPAGLGSNDVGLDRGLFGEERVVQFRRTGNQILLYAPNLTYRALEGDAPARRAVEEAFAASVLWRFPIVARQGDRFLIDASDFALHDAMDVVGRLRQTNQGTFRLDRDRSTILFEAVKAFPRNTVIEALLTFSSEQPGRFVRQVAAVPEHVTLRQRLMFVALPPPGYRPRAHDPRSGLFFITFYDYTSPVGEPLARRWIVRHRLQKKDPNAPVSEPVEPIVYYVDPGAPEPIRQALIDGASWWAEAFEAAGFRNAFRVEVLPDTADPLDVRYNVIQWVHRATRGWSYGRTIVDPRTGEIIKGHVTLGSLRIRQDYLIFEGLLAPYDSAHAHGYPPESDPMLQLALARIRQLAAHEVGHTLGLQHNFAASVNDRASVMDYPAPYVRVRPDGLLDVSEAYDTGIGAWDKVAIRYAYSEFPPGTDETAALEAILEEAARQGLHFITDADARPPGGAHPLAHLWDNGTDAVAALHRELQVRKVALERFGLRNLRAGRPLATLEEVLVPIYLWHRYQTEATVKLLGGAFYTYAVRTPDMPEAPVVRPVPGATQRAALEALLTIVQPATLRLPETLCGLIPPRPPGYPAHRELFARQTAPLFDPVAPAKAAARQVFDLLLQPERLSRLHDQALQDPSLPSLSEVLEQVSRNVWAAPVPDDPYDAHLQRVVQTAWTAGLLERARDARTPVDVRVELEAHLRRLSDWLTQNPGTDAATRAHRRFHRDWIQRFLNRPYTPEEPVAPELELPPGAPIGLLEQVLEQPRRLLEATYDPGCALIDYGAVASGT
ncbi:zinc-dependent metalloprotease [Rhodothermus marinus]|uniref:zinc-dependent metalloprotease n=1 Tax=Rhodothermus marinus TaxID=29549 RepID=UPI001DBFE51D|nr:zinc-dependent metalloprotease [Rhodothermus marinus]MBO2492941.1 DUF5117 domain-containing protein [Rhodothermus marinus]